MTGSEREGHWPSPSNSRRRDRAPHDQKPVRDEVLNGSLYLDHVIFGGAEGDRTPDLMTASHALSQLSYGPKVCG